MQNSTSSEYIQQPSLPAVYALVTINQVIVLIIGIIANLLILIAMPKAKIPSNTKLLLWMLAFGDFFALLFVGEENLLITIPSMLTGAPIVFFNLDLVDCKLEYFIYECLEMMTQWLLVIISGERFFVVYFPFRAANLNLRKALFFVAAVVLASILVTCPDLIYRVISDGQCYFEATFEVSNNFFIIRHILVEHFLPQFLVFAANGLIMYALIKRQRQKKHMSAVQSGGDSKSSLKVTKGLVIASSIHAVLYAQCGIVCVFSFLYTTASNSILMNEVYYISGSIYIWAHSFSFFVYYATIDSFRKAIKRKHTKA